MSDVQEKDLLMTLDEVLPFLIICKDWEVKDDNYVIHNLNALCGKSSWELLTLSEAEQLWSWLERNELTEEERWRPLKKHLEKEGDGATV